MNIGGKTSVAMADLRALLADLGLEDGKSLLQSGNLLFRASDREPAELEALLENATTERLGLQTDYFVRSAVEWAAAVAANPYPEAARSDPSHLVLMTLKSEPPGTPLESLRAGIPGRETVELVGRQAYLVYPDGIGSSKVTLKLIESKLGTRATGRNWNTVQKVAALLAEMDLAAQGR